MQIDIRTMASLLTAALMMLASAASAQTIQLQVAATNGGAGLVRMGNFSCGLPCSLPVATGASATVTVSAATGWVFGGWSGCDVVAGNACTVTVNAPRTITALLTRIANPTHTDLNGDGRSDIPWYNSASGLVFGQRMNGLAPGGGDVIDQAADLNWKVAAIADLNSDGKADIVWRNTLTGEVYGVLKDDGTTIAQGVIHTESNLDWKIVGSGHFAETGKTALFWHNGATGEVTIQGLDGLTKVNGGRVYLEPNLNWRVEKIADFDGNRSADILWRNAATGDVFVLLMGGMLPYATSGVIYSEPNLNWQIVAAADFDGDGKADILWRNTTTGDVYMMLMNGAAIAGGSVFYNEPDQAWQVAAARDYNGDGRADILWHNANTGQVFMMLMNGAAITQGDFVYTEPDQNWKIVGP